MTTAQVVETSVTVNNNCPVQDHVYPDEQTQPTFEMTPGFKPFTVLVCVSRVSLAWLRGNRDDCFAGPGEWDGGTAMYGLYGYVLL